MRRFSFIFSLIILIFTNAQSAGNYNYIDPERLSSLSIDEPKSYNRQTSLNDYAKLKDQAGQIIKIQAAADKKEIEQAQNEVFYTPGLILQYAAPKHVYDDLAKHPATSQLLQRTARDCELITQKFKDYWQVKRPYLVDSRIKLLITPPLTTSYAYPSGHTACSLVTAEVASQIMGELAYEFQRRAKEIAAHRILGGVHWPQDIEGGRQLGFLIFGALQMSDKYLADEKAAQAEWEN